MGDKIFNFFRINGKTGDVDSLCRDKGVVERVGPFRDREELNFLRSELNFVGCSIAAGVMANESGFERRKIER